MEHGYDKTYYYIESQCIREHLARINYQFTEDERLFLIYNAPHLGYDEKIAYLEQELPHINDKYFGNQVEQRVKYMKQSTIDFDQSKDNEVYTIRLIDKNGQDINQRMVFRNFSSVYQYCLSICASLSYFEIHKNMIIDEYIDNIFAEYKIYKCALGYANLMDCKVRNKLVTDGDATRFEFDVTVNLPHPFRKGDIVTDGSIFYYIDEDVDDTISFEGIYQNPYIYPITFDTTEEREEGDQTMMHDCIDVRKITFAEGNNDSELKSFLILDTFVKYNKEREGVSYVATDNSF